jgi:V/A-type H+-transporting ATPase subunit I
MSVPNGTGSKEVLTLAIAKMTRVFMVGASAHRDETMRFLQRAGVVHLEPVVPLSGDFEKQASAALLRLRRIGQIEQAVGRYRNLKESIPADCPDEGLSARAEETLNSLQELRNRRQALERLGNDLAPWGDFDLDQIRSLDDNGVHVRRWRMERKKRADLNVPEGVFVEIVTEKQGLLFYTISIAGSAEIPGASPLPWPEIGLSGCVEEIGRLNREEKTLIGRLAGIALRADVLKAQVTSALNEARYLENMGTLHAEEYLFGLQGWVPAGIAAGLLKQVEEQRLPLQVEVREPLSGEEPPVLYENNWFNRRIEPLLKLYGNPKYRDLDPSYFFAPFMILFFGVCYGDAGYGVIMYLAAHAMGKKWGEQVDGLPLVVKLCKAFAVSAVFVGIITGSIFGLNFDNREWIMIDVAVGVGDPMLFFYLALGLGVLHLSFSYLMGMMQAGSWISRMSKLGLLCVLWGGVFLVSRNIWFDAPGAALNQPLAWGGFGALGLGLLLTLFFSSDHKHWGIRLGLGLWSIYGLTGLIGDLLSYARLFGLGIATSAIASVMNQLAEMVLGAAGPIFGIPLALIVLILGHTFNLVLGILGSTVHSARLHFVEAFKSFFEGGGVEYKPFKIERGSL